VAGTSSNLRDPMHTLAGCERIVVVGRTGSGKTTFARELAAKTRRMPIAQRLPLAEVARAHELMERGSVGGKILLLP